MARCFPAPLRRKGGTTEEGAAGGCCQGVGLGAVGWHQGLSDASARFWAQVQLGAGLQKAEGWPCAGHDGVLQC